MSHTIRDQKKLLARVRRIRGQVEGIERALANEAGCDQVMHLIAGARGAMAGLMAEIVEDLEAVNDFGRAVRVQIENGNRAA